MDASSANDLKKNVEIYKLWDYNIKAAGIKFHQAELSQLYPKDWANLEIELVREPENQYDPNAIKILVDGLHVGYIPALIASAMSGHLERGVDFEKKVIYITAAVGKKSHTIKIALNRR